MPLSDAPIIELDTVDSTNNYAMQLIDENTAQHGLTITAERQTKGKGQRGRTWLDIPGESLLMSMIVHPGRSLNEQFAFNASVATAIADTISSLYDGWNVCVKWPNDIIINDKKAGGVLIENVLRGHVWTYAIIGFGLNVRQVTMPDDLPYATSLKIASGKSFDVADVRDKLRDAILASIEQPAAVPTLMGRYNDYLYRRGKEQKFSNADGTWVAIVVKANPDGTLMVQLPDGRITTYVHGQATWEW